MTGTVKGGADQRTSLQCWEGRQPVEGGPGLQSLLDELGDVRPVHGIRNHQGNRRRSTQLVERHIVSDPVQPRPGVSDLGARCERPPRLKEGLLYRVLGRARVGLQSAAVGDQLPPVPTHQGLKGCLVAFT
jgi:hypothetical protein